MRPVITPLVMHMCGYTGGVAIIKIYTYPAICSLTNTDYLKNIFDIAWHVASPIKRKIIFLTSRNPFFVLFYESEKTVPISRES